LARTTCLLVAVLLAAAAQFGFAEETTDTAMATTPAAPRITYPGNETDALKTAVAWMGDAHDACEVRIGAKDSVEDASVWRSGEVTTVDSRVATGELPPATKLYGFARLRNASGWGPWSAAAEFATPDAPIVRILTPSNAGRVRGPEVTVNWSVEPAGGVTGQSATIDGKRCAAIAPEDRSLVLTGVRDGVHTMSLKLRFGDKIVERTARFYVYRLAQQSTSKLYTLDLQSLHKIDVGDPKQTAMAFETLQLCAVLQGLINREKAQFYIDYIDVDKFWLGKIREKGAWLERAELVPLASVEEAISQFAGKVKGVVVWDPSLPCTSNIASTICGVENLLPVRFDETPGSMYDRIVRHGPKLKVVRNLVGMFTGKGKIPGSERDSTGSRKCDAYLWAKMQYLDTGKCNPREIGYWCDAFWLQHPTDMSLDNVGLTNHDFVVTRKGFIFDLGVWDDEAPRDEPDQRFGLDLETFKEVLLSCHTQSKGKIIHFSGFTPWAIKYTDHGNVGGKHGGVETEWETGRIASTYNCYMDADAIGYVGMANASVYALCKLPDRLVQNPPPTREDLEATGYIDAEGNVARLNYIYHYLGDYDSAAWMYHRIPQIWPSEARGQVPSGWAFNPNLIERMPVVFDWCYETKRPSDYFIAGDSGAGYVNPTQLLPPRKPSGLPSGEDAWIEHNTGYFRQLNYSITGFLINGFSGELTNKSNRMFLPFSGDGVMTQLHWMPKTRKQDHLLDGMPVAGMKQDITAPIDVVVKAMVRHCRPGETRFLAFRSILVDPDWIRTVNEQVRQARPDCRFEPVDPYTYFYLLRHTLGGANDKRATYTFDTMPDRVSAGKSVRIEVGVRNDGWDTWKRDGADAVHLLVSFSGRSGGVRAALPFDVAPGEGAVIAVEVDAPCEPGKHAVLMELVKGKDGYFGDAHDMPWKKAVTVR